MKYRTIGRVAAGVCLALLLAGCATEVHIKPDVGPKPAGAVSVSSNIVFEGNRDYLPRNLRQATDNPAGITVYYRYDVAYGTKNLGAAALFDPITIFGLPTGKDILTIVAELRIQRGSRLLKAYQSACQIVERSNLWTNRTQTELRREGLLAVRDNIESQLALDREYLASLALLH